jgi:hypothetical protein
MTQNSEVSMPMPASANQTICSNCHSVMPSDLRFCRNCGFRLADAMGAYTGTQFGEVAADQAKGKRRRMSGLSWLFVGLLVFFIGAAAFTALVSPARQSGSIVSRPQVVKSYIGIDEVNNTDDGHVILNSVSVPDGPADKAGLVGGDLLVKVDGQPVQNEDQMDDLMEKIPVEPLGFILHADLHVTMLGDRQFLQRHGRETHIAAQLAGAIAEVFAELAFRRAAHVTDGENPESHYLRLPTDHMPSRSYAGG